MGESSACGGFFFFQAEDGIRDMGVTGVQTCALPIWAPTPTRGRSSRTSGATRSVPEVRVDPLTGLRAIVAGDRATRPGAGLTTTPADPIDPATDPFLEGHEDRTPPEVAAVRPGGGPADAPGWTVRVVP